MYTHHYYHSSSFLSHLWNQPYSSQEQPKRLGEPTQHTEQGNCRACGQDPGNTDTQWTRPNGRGRLKAGGTPEVVGKDTSDLSAAQLGPARWDLAPPVALAALDRAEMRKGSIAFEQTGHQWWPPLQLTFPLLGERGCPPVTQPRPPLSQRCWLLSCPPTFGVSSERRGHEDREAMQMRQSRVLFRKLFRSSGLRAYLSLSGCALACATEW